jgi:hypothetical protein
MEGVEKLPVHDALIKSIDLDWPESILVIHLSAFIEKGRSASPFTLTFTGVTDISVPHKSPWGDSNSINGIEAEPNGCSIEIQSGDKILVEALGYTFESTNL